ncbi:uncharacterized protein K489DRAFT_372714 [Dissoconium aciculare CBS 342.82]|uniref:Mid2 domain-containing protein n=1 Tax=Dissoconium aciculare CBS 342.82 TaxID=1314786 RepID=A0A6J3LZX6_9PEZI|nr:uncharacterized protein K489DRAFT_372714 [Dissoconium aciculare CBS 342.82]KAF1820192.1 hypothetical protein K489DRAFT_372714 [Dissoconium aciculare CBS 342.82]
MLSDFFGFAQIPSDILPDGIMFKRQVATGLSVGTSLPTTDLTAITNAAGGVTSGVNAITSQTTPTATPTTAPPPSDTTPTVVAPTTATPAPSPTDNTATRTQQTTEPNTTQPPNTLATTTRDGTTGTTSAHTTATGADSFVSSLTGTSSNLVIVGGSSTINRSTLSSATTITSPLVGSATVASVYTSFYVGSDGKSTSAVLTTSRVLSSTTGFATATILPALQNSGDGDGNGSLSPMSRSVIGGVVGGIGGAILLGGLAIVAWRLWGKKKSQRESLTQEDYLNQGRSDYSRGNSFGAEKRISPLSSSYGGMSPGAASTYTNPNGKVNTASNF